MQDLVASLSYSSGGREASTGCFTKSCWCSVGFTCFSVCCTGNWFHLVILMFARFMCSCSCQVNIFPHRFMLTPKQQDLFERIAVYCDQFTNISFIPVPFVLGQSERTASRLFKPCRGLVNKSVILFFSGFYVNVAFNRWWGQYTSFPLPDNLMMVVSGNVHGADEKGRMLRRTLMRYANLSSVLILRSISTRVLKRFPTLDHVVEAGKNRRDGKWLFLLLWLIKGWDDTTVKL